MMEIDLSLVSDENLKLVEQRFAEKMREERTKRIATKLKIGTKVRNVSGAAEITCTAISGNCYYFLTEHGLKKKKDPKAGWCFMFYELADRIKIENIIETREEEHGGLAE